MNVKKFFFFFGFGNLEGVSDIVRTGLAKQWRQKVGWSELKGECSVVIIVLIAIGQIQLLDKRYSLQPETTIPLDMSIYVITIWHPHLPPH